MSQLDDRRALMLSVAAAIRAWPGSTIAETVRIVEREQQILKGTIYTPTQIARAIQALLERGELKRKKTGRSTTSFEPCFAYYPTDPDYPPALPLTLRGAPRPTNGFSSRQAKRSSL